MRFVDEISKESLHVFFFLKEKDSELVACSRQALATIDHILPSGANKET